MTKPRILYLCHCHQTAVSIGQRYPREEVRAVQMNAVMGHRGDVVVIQPPDPSWSERELEQYRATVEHARTKTCNPATPLIMGEVL